MGDVTFFHTYVLNSITGILVLLFLSFVFSSVDILSLTSSMLLFSVIAIILGLFNRSGTFGSYGNPRDLHRSNMFGDAYGRHAYDTIGNKNKGFIDGKEEQEPRLSRILISGGLVTAVLGLLLREFI